MAVNGPANGTLAGKLGESLVGSRDDLDISRHVFFGETSYVVRDPVTFEGHNFSPSDYEIFTNLRDDVPLNQVFESLVERKVISREEEEDFYRFVIELQKRGLLSLPVTDGESLYQQYEQRRKKLSKNLLMKVLFLKVPLGCPDRFLRSTYHWVRWVFTPAFFTIWLVSLILAMGLVISQWTQFTSELSSVLAIQNLPAILLVMSLLKLWHELGHGYACRHFGVSVPNAGLLFMIGTPLAFMDATGSWSLSKRSQRQIINLAGIYFEMMIAIVAAVVWVTVENPAIKSLAHFTLLVSSVTTIGFNINPLMKFDGYFVLADSLGIPNLKSRASVSVQAFFKRIFLGIRTASDDSMILKVILLVYGIASGIYKISLVFGISIMIAMQIWVIGILVGGYYFLTSLGAMSIKVGKYLVGSDEVKDRRALATLYLLVLFVGIPSAICFLPMPGRGQARGVVEHEIVHVVHLEEGGFLQAAPNVQGRYVQKGEPLATVENIDGHSKRMRRKAELANLETQFRRYHGFDKIQSQQVAKKIEQVKFELSFDRGKSQTVEIKAPEDGFIVSGLDTRSVGRYLEPGMELLKIGDGGWVVQAVANASSLANIQPQPGQAVYCRFDSNPQSIVKGTVGKVSVSGSRVVRHKALTHLAGGFIPVDPDSMEATEPFFEMTIHIDQQPEDLILKSGIACEIRFDQSNQTVGKQLYRSLLRLFNKINLR